MGDAPQIFENQDLDLAVAVGAAYYGYARTTGSGVLVRGGLPRAYFLGLQEDDPQAVRAVCLVPRGSEEGQEIRLEQTDLQLVANKPVAFRLYSSLLRTEDRPGDVVSFPVPENATDATSEPRLHAPLHAVIRFGKGGEKLIPVTVGARLSEVGTLEAWAESKISEHWWRLQFQLRKSSRDAEGVQPGAVPVVRSTAVIGEDAQSRAEDLLQQVFGPGASGFSPGAAPGHAQPRDQPGHGRGSSRG